MSFHKRSKSLFLHGRKVLTVEATPPRAPEGPLAVAFALPLSLAVAFAPPLSPAVTFPLPSSPAVILHEDSEADPQEFV